MKKSKLFLTIAAGILLAGITPGAFAAAASQPPITITGLAVCGKCVLHETKKCQNVVQVQQGGKTVNYYLVQNDVSKAFHKNICGTSGEKVTVTGTAEMKDGKEVMTPTKIEPVK
ncbi:MAG: DUF6370 family protein [Limisphaerales bacterium]